MHSGKAGHFRRAGNLTKKQAIILIIACCFFIGIIFGAVFAVILEPGYRQRLSLDVGYYFRGFDGGVNPDSFAADMFRNGVFKYGKVIVIIWFLSFAPTSACLISTAFISAARGAGYGFTTALLLMTLGSAAFGAIAVYLPQFFITVPACFFMSYFSVNFSLKSSGEPARFNAKESFAILLGGMCFVLLAAAADAVLSPMIMDQTSFIR